MKLASLWSLYKFTNGFEKLFLLIGLFAAALSGVGQPLFIIWLGDMSDAFGVNVDVDDTIRELRKITLIYVYIGIALWLLAYIYYSSLGYISETVGVAFR